MGVGGSAGPPAPAATRRGLQGPTPPWPTATVPLSTALVSCPECTAYLEQSVLDALHAYPFAGEAPFAQRGMPANSSPWLWAFRCGGGELPLLAAHSCISGTPAAAAAFSPASIRGVAAPAGVPYGVHQVLRSRPSMKSHVAHSAACDLLHTWPGACALQQPAGSQQEGSAHWTPLGLHSEPCKALTVRPSAGEGAEHGGRGPPGSRQGNHRDSRSRDCSRVFQSRFVLDHCSAVASTCSLVVCGPFNKVDL